MGLPRGDPRGWKEARKKGCKEPGLSPGRPRRGGAERRDREREKKGRTEREGAADVPPCRELVCPAPATTKCAK